MKSPFAARKARRSLGLEGTRNLIRRRSGSILRDIVSAFGVLAVVSASVVVLMYGTSWVLYTPYLKVKEVIVRGCKELTEKDVLALAAVVPQQNILVVNLEETDRRVQASPWVREAYVGREFPSRIVIEVRERVPVALIRKESTFFLLDREGNTFKALERGDEADLPVLTGCYRNGAMDTALLGKAMALLAQLSKNAEFPNAKAVSEIACDDRIGLTVFTTIGLSLVLGADDYEGKLKRLPPVLADLDRRNYKPGFIQIDLSDPAKITVQQKNILMPQQIERPKAQIKT